MKSKISICNKRIILEDIKRFSWISFLYGYIIFLFLPLQIIINYNSNLLIETGATIILTMLVPVILSILIFRYLHVQAASDFTHSLPIKKVRVYRSHIFAGVILLSAPVLVNGFICLILKLLPGIGNRYSVYTLMLWVGSTISVSLMIYFISVCIGMVIGTAVVQVALTYLIIALPMLISDVINYNLTALLYGYVFDLSKIGKQKEFMIEVFFENNSIYTIWKVTAFLTIGIILYFLGQFLYNKRKVENASETLAFISMQYLFEYFVTFSSMLVVGAIYIKNINYSTNWIYFGYFMGSFLGYFAVEIMIRKSLRVFANIKGYLIYVILVTAVLLGIRFDVIGYERRIPEVNSIKNIYFCQESYLWEADDIFSEETISGMEKYSEKKAFETLISFHQEILNNKSEDIKNSIENSQQVCFLYKLSDGTLIARKYNVSIGKYNEFIKIFHESEEYKKEVNNVLKIDTMDADSITISSLPGNGKKTIINKPEDVKEALDMLRKDIINETYEQMEDEKAPWAAMNIFIANDKINKYNHLRYIEPNGRFFATWRKSDILFEEWLKTKGYTNNSRIMPEDIAYATVENCKTKQQWNVRFSDNSDYIGGNLKGIEISDKSQIEACLRNYKYLNKANEDKYIIEFYMKDKSKSFYGSFDETSVPQAIRSYIHN